MMRAVLNIWRWNKTKNPTLSNKAKSVKNLLLKSPAWKEAVVAAMSEVEDAIQVEAMSVKFLPQIKPFRAIIDRLDPDKLEKAAKSSKALFQVEAMAYKYKDTNLKYANMFLKEVEKHRSKLIRDLRTAPREMRNGHHFYKKGETTFVQALVKAFRAAAVSLKSKLPFAMRWGVTDATPKPPSTNVRPQIFFGQFSTGDSGRPRFSGNLLMFSIYSWIDEGEARGLQPSQILDDLFGEAYAFIMHELTHYGQFRALGLDDFVEERRKLKERGLRDSSEEMRELALRRSKSGLSDLSSTDYAVHDWQIIEIEAFSFEAAYWLARKGIYKVDLLNDPHMKKYVEVSYLWSEWGRSRKRQGTVERVGLIETMVNEWLVAFKKDPNILLYGINPVTDKAVKPLRKPTKTEIDNVIKHVEENTEKFKKGKKKGKGKVTKRVKKDKVLAKKERTYKDMTDEELDHLYETETDPVKRKAIMRAVLKKGDANDPTKVKEIAKDHLEEHGKYYTALKKMEKTLEEKQADIRLEAMSVKFFKQLEPISHALSPQEAVPSL